MQGQAKKGWGGGAKIGKEPIVELAEAVGDVGVVVERPGKVASNNLISPFIYSGEMALNDIQR